MTSAATSVLVIGCGDIGERVARLERFEGCQVAGLVRAEGSARRPRATGIQPITADLDVPTSLHELFVNGALIYISRSAPGKGVTDPRMGTFVSCFSTSEPPTRRWTEPGDGSRRRMFCGAGTRKAGCRS